MSHRDRQILQLALPSIISNITVPLLGLVDVAIVGHIGDASFIAAIAVGSMIFNTLYWLFGFLRMGTSGLTAQALGARQLDEAAALLWRSLLVAMSVAGTILLFQVPLRHLAFFLMRPTPEVELLAIPYYYIVVWGAPAMLGLYGLTGWFVGMQNTRMPMFISIFQNVVNILASLFFVFALGMRVEGVALGTVVAQWTGFLVALGLLWHSYGRRLLRRASREAVLRLQDYGRFFAVNRDIFLRTLFLVAVNLFFTSAGAAQGAMILAVNTLLMQLYLLFSYIMDGFAFAGEALSGRYYGARNFSALGDVVSRLFRWGAAMVVLFTAAYAWGGPSFLHLLTSDNSVIHASADYFFWALLIPVAGVGAFIWDGIFIGLTMSRGMFVSSAWSAVSFFAVYFLLGHCHLLSSLGPNHALWLSMVVYLAMRGIIQTGLYRQANAS